MLKKLGKRGSKPTRSHLIPASEFKDNFKRLSRDRFDKDPEVLKVAVGVSPELRNMGKAREASEMMTETPEREEIEEALKKMRESTPGADGQRVAFLREATEEAREIFVELVRFMFEKRAHMWKEKLKIEIMVPLFKKGYRAN